MQLQWLCRTDSRLHKNVGFSGLEETPFVPDAAAAPRARPVTAAAVTHGMSLLLRLILKVAREWVRPTKSGEGNRGIHRRTCREVVTCLDMPCNSAPSAEWVIWGKIAMATRATVQIVQVLWSMPCWVSTHCWGTAWLLVRDYVVSRISWKCERRHFGGFLLFEVCFLPSVKTKNTQNFRTRTLHWDLSTVE